jgi:hypothetical protein
MCPHQPWHPPSPLCAPLRGLRRSCDVVSRGMRRSGICPQRHRGHQELYRLALCRCLRPGPAARACARRVLGRRQARSASRARVERALKYSTPTAVWQRSTGVGSIGCAPFTAGIGTPSSGITRWRKETGDHPARFPASRAIGTTSASWRLAQSAASWRAREPAARSARWHSRERLPKSCLTQTDARCPRRFTPSSPSGMPSGTRGRHGHNAFEYYYVVCVSLTRHNYTCVEYFCFCIGPAEGGQGFWGAVNVKAPSRFASPIISTNKLSPRREAFEEPACFTARDISLR